jgi:kinesin family protein 13
MTHFLFFFFQSAEIDLHTKCVVDVDANKVILNPVNTDLSKGDAR